MRAQFAETASKLLFSDSLHHRARSIFRNFEFFFFRGGVRQRTPRESETRSLSSHVPSIDPTCSSGLTLTWSSTTRPSPRRHALTSSFGFHHLECVRATAPPETASFEEKRVPGEPARRVSAATPRFPDLKLAAEKTVRTPATRQKPRLRCAIFFLFFAAFSINAPFSFFRMGCKLRLRIVCRSGECFRLRFEPKFHQQIRACRAYRSPDSCILFVTDFLFLPFEYIAPVSKHRVYAAWW